MLLNAVITTDYKHIRRKNKQVIVDILLTKAICLPLFVELSINDWTCLLYNCEIQTVQTSHNCYTRPDMINLWDNLLVFTHGIVTW